MTEEEQAKKDSDVERVRAKLQIMNVPLPTKGSDGEPLPELNFEVMSPKIAITFVDGDAMAGSIVLVDEARKAPPIAQIVKLPCVEIADVVSGGWSGHPLFFFLRPGDIVLIGAPVREVPTSWGEKKRINLCDVGAIQGFYTTSNGVILTDHVSADWDKKGSTSSIVSAAPHILAPY